MTIRATNPDPRRWPRRPGATLATLALLCGALSACVSVPRPQTDTQLPASYSTAPDAAHAVSLVHWWENFNDPQLNALITTAHAKSPDARRAAAVLDEARALRTGQVRQMYWPSSTVLATAKRTGTQLRGSNGNNSSANSSVNSSGNAPAGVRDSVAVNIDVSWELDLFGRRSAALSVLDNDMEAAQFAYEATRLALAANVAQSYFEARGLALQLDDAREAARISTSLSDLSIKKTRAGLSAAADADRTAAELAQSRALVVDLEAQLAQAQRSLLILVGRATEPLSTLSALASPAASASLAAPPVPASLPGELLVRRPDVRAAQRRLWSALGKLRVSELSLLPTFNIMPGIGWSRDGLPASSKSMWSFGANLSLPLLNIPALLADVDSEQARARQAALAYELAVQTAFGEADTAILRLSAEQQRVVLLTAGQGRAERAHLAARKGYQAGLSDLTTALQAEQVWRTARAAMTSATIQVQLGTVQTYKALGGGWSPDPLARRDLSLETGGDASVTYHP